MITYIGKRITTTGSLSFFYLFENGDKRGGKKNPNLPIGSILNDEWKATGDMASSKDIADWTIEELNAEAQIKENRINKKLLKENPNEIKKFIKYMKSLNVSEYEKYKILEVVRRSITL